MKLKYKTERIVDCYDLDQLVEKVYGRTFCFQQQEGCKSRGVDYFSVPMDSPYDFEGESIPEVINGADMGVSFKAWLERDPKQKLQEGEPDYLIELFWQRNFYPSLEKVVQDLYEKGHIEEGDYTIVIDW